jgi:copper/silver efflux system protein
MLGRIVEFSARNQILVVLVFTAAALWGWWSMLRVPLDAIPELGDTQVIIYSSWDRSPDIVEDQLTYPIVSAMLGAPRVKAVRGYSDFGYSFVYVIFEDSTDLYWARSRTMESLSPLMAQLPEGAKTELGPDATGLGWIFQYALVDTSGHHDLADLRSVQDWYLRFHLKSVPGVAEVAPIGGFTRQYQVNVDPNRLRAYDIPIHHVVDAVRGGNIEVGGRLLEFGGSEYMVRGRGYAQSAEDIGNIVLKATEAGTPVRICDVGEVVFGPDLRRGVDDLDGTGEVVSGIVIMRQGGNALDVIERVQAKIRQIEPGLPDGVRLVPVYDRSQLIKESISNLKSTIAEEILTVAFVIFLFLRHIPSAAIPMVTIPIAILLSFVPFRALGMTANIMSLGGMAIAIGALVDAAIVVVEQTHNKLEQWEREGRQGNERDVIIEAIKEVAGPCFFAVLVIAVSFLPVLTLQGQEGRLFKPLAYTKTLSMLVAAALVITLDPALRLLLTRTRNLQFRPRWLCRGVNAALVGKIGSEGGRSISRALIRLYEPVVWWTLANKRLVFGITLAMMIATIPVYVELGSEFMPPLDEGTLLYMPTTMPGVSIAQAQQILQVSDRILKQFPEVDRVLGKAGRADTPTDPAPLSMFETVITLRPKDEWRRVPVWYSPFTPEWLKPVLRHIVRDSISTEQLINEMNAAVNLPGLSNSWTMPIKGRIDMLNTGIRTPIGVKIYGPDPKTIEKIGAQVESVLSSVPGTRSVFAERTGGGRFLDFEWKREALAKYGVSVEDAQTAVENAIGGNNVTTIIQGRARYPVNVRYMRDFRSDINGLGRVLVPAMGGRRQIPIEDLASIKTVDGPAMLRSEGGMLTGFVYLDV